MNKVIITTDSTCDLSDELLEKYSIKVIPLYVMFGEESYLDRVNITTEKLYELVEEKGILPKTATQPSEAYYEFFKQFIDEGYSVVHVSISTKLSGSYQQSYLASQRFEEGQVHVVDSMSLSSGVGLVAMKASQFAKMGLSAEEVAEKAREIAPRVQTAFVIDTMEYLYKGGRCSGIANFIGTLLKIKPIIHMKDGAMEVGEKPLGRKKAYELLLNKIYRDKDNLDPEFVMVTHSLNFETAEYLKAELRKNLEIENLYETVAGCTISSHCGKGTIGILYITKE